MSSGIMKKDREESTRPSSAMADPRFARVQTDPRFMRMPKNKSKVSIDKRFSHMFSEKKFSDPLGADKRGRTNKRKDKHMLERYYKLDEDEDEDGGGASGAKPGVSSKSKGKKNAKNSKGEQIGLGLGQRKEVVRPKIPRPDSGVETDEGSDEKGNSDEEIDVQPKRKGKDSGKTSKLGFEDQGTKSGRPKSPVPDEEIDQKVKPKEKDSGKLASKTVPGDTIKGPKTARPKFADPVVEESAEDDSSEEEIGEEIDLNSDESEEELEREARIELKNPVAQQGGDDSQEDVSGDSEEEEEELSSSSSSSSSESEDEEDLDDSRTEEKVPTAPGAETRRFAMMCMDWEHIKAVDLLMLMRSFQPKTGRVECVTVYPSEFGIEQMKAEEVHGPNTIFEEDDDEEDEDKEVSMEKLRAYEKNKLKYYYAVVECDSKETANHLYTQCDGMEFERTSNTLDLRFIPDDMTFVRDPRDVAKEVQGGYNAPEFETRALQHSTVKLTWDDDEPTRVKALRKKFNADELNEMDFRAYLASESSDEEVNEDEEETPSSPERGGATNAEEVNLRKDKYRSLLLGDSTEDVERPGQKTKKGDVDMEVTFHTGLTELSEKLMQKKEAKNRGDESVWESYLRKKKEKKAQKKRSKNAKSDDDDYSEEDVASPRRVQGEADPFFTHEENGFDDPFFADDGEFPDESKAAAKKSSKTKSKDAERLKKREENEQQKKDEERRKAEIELLLMDDEGLQGSARGFNLKSNKDNKKKKDKGEKKKNNNSNKKKGGKDDDDQEEEDKLATADLTDPRFAPLFSNHHYAIDPTNPQFRKSATVLKVLAESQRRRMQKSDDGGDPNSTSRVGNADATDVGLHSQDRKRKAEISSLVKSLKRKANRR